MFLCEVVEILFFYCCVLIELKLPVPPYKSRGQLVAWGPHAALLFTYCGPPVKIDATIKKKSAMEYFSLIYQTLHTGRIQ